MRKELLSALVALVLCISVPGSALADPGRPFLSHDINRSAEQLVAAFENSRFTPGLTPVVVLVALQEAGAPVTSWSEVSNYLRGLQEVVCPLERFQTGIYRAIDREPGYELFVREPVAGERCLEDPNGFLISLYCGNPFLRQMSKPIKFNRGVLRHCVAPCSYSHQGGLSQ